jgi:hypothetical protein
MGQLLQILKYFSPNKQGETACAGKLKYNYLLRSCSDSLIPIWIGMDCGLIHVKNNHDPSQIFYSFKIGLD